MSKPGLTGSQTVGPFFAICLSRPEAIYHELAEPGTAGDPIRLEGRILDGDGAPVPDALVEIWQANAHGRYNHPLDQRPLPLDPGFRGYGRSDTDEDGRYWFETIKPGRVPAADGGEQAPHIVVTVFSRGLLNQVVTRLYFADDPANEQDPVLRLVPAERRGTMLAQPTHVNGKATYRFDIVLQGEGETVFLNV